MGVAVAAAAGPILKGLGKMATSELAKANGDKRLIEKYLGYPEGSLANEKLVRIDIPKNKNLSIRIPSGREAGANPLWIPGGKLPTGISEAVIDVTEDVKKSVIISPLDL